MSGSESIVFWCLVIILQLPLLAIMVAAAAGFAGLVKEDVQRTKPIRVRSGLGHR